jgi:branched-chain amino acid transport system ATP-binding protein
VTAQHDAASSAASPGAEPAAPGVLSVRGLTVRYLHGPVAVRSVDLDAKPGSVTAIVGPNGAGKTTLLEAIAGRERRSPARILSGTVSLGNRDLTRLSVHQVSRVGVSLIPDRNKVFDDLSVDEHIKLSLLRLPRSRRESVRDDVLSAFPRVGRWLDRRGAQLSGGERQLAALAISLCAEPSVLLIDEMSQGLSPAAVSEVVGALRSLRGRDLAVVVVEQTTATAARVADTVLHFVRGAFAQMVAPDGEDA